jgi:hypothetical protein
LKFLDEYNSLVSKKVTNFDELVKEIEEKSRTLKSWLISVNLCNVSHILEGSVQETPLTDYLYKIAMEKVSLSSFMIIALVLIYWEILID